MTGFSPIKEITGALFPIVVCMAMTGCTYTQLAQSPPDYVEYAEPEAYYYDGPFAELSEWGTWADAGPLGWVWRPYGSSNWQPYYHGNWVWSQWGWAWASYEPFGWAAYHYGFWHYDAIYGWVWIPDEQWFPSRVTWMYYGDYVYWAPIPPPGYYIADPWDVHSDFIWMGVQFDHFLQNDVGRYRLKGPPRPWTDVPRTRIRRDAPKVNYVEQRTRRRIHTVDVTRQKIRKGGREYERMILPPAEKKVVDRFERRREEATRPKPTPKSQGKRRTGTKRPVKQKRDAATQNEKRDTRAKTNKTKKSNDSKKSKDR